MLHETILTQHAKFNNDADLNRHVRHVTHHRLLRQH